MKGKKDGGKVLILIVFAFLAGLATILSPCILPVLPIVLSAAVGEGKRRPLGVVAGFILSFTFFTLTLATIVKITHLPGDFLRMLAITLVAAFGVSLLFPQTQLFLEKIFTRFANLVPTSNNTSGFWGGFGVGLSIGVLWAPCVGPILASVITLAVASQVSLAAFFITLAYSLGTALPMLAITYGGRNLLKKIPGLLANTGKIQKVFGVVMIVTAVALFFNLDRKFQNYILQVFPQYGSGLTAFEENDTVKQGLTQLKKTAVPIKAANQKAPDFVGGNNWLNSQPLSLTKELKGKVVLVDFWTYSCINCIRTLPYIKQWYATYKDKDFVIIGVHTPEFEFEKKTDNVAQALKDFGIEYPVVQDNNFSIWNAYGNEAWPAHYLIDKNGFVRYTHFGEGKYVETENAIRTLLDEELIDKPEVDSTYMPQTGETYLGYKRAESYIFENKIELDKAKEYELKMTLPKDGVGLQGNWNVGPESIVTANDDSSLSINFLAKKVHLVMGNVSPSKSGKVKVLLDGKPLPKKYWTTDMNDSGEVTVTQTRKYDVIDLGDDYGRHVLQLIFSENMEAFAFTFGT
jgi:cytochrome c biogenesis protein CcdA/thiol-disulfide isomerase/thioredoxin